ncbi:MAG: dipeptidase [Roseburia sp.]|nr:dipeptidase [Roseburia sp.]
MKIIDMHCDTISRLYQQKCAGTQEGLDRNDGHLDLKRMGESGYLLQNFALFVNQGACEDSWQEVCALHEIYEEQMLRNQERISPVRRYEDIAEAEAAGRMGAMLTVEEGGVCGGSIERLEELYDWGVRMLTLTWNYPNELGRPAKTAQGEGLTPKGREFIGEMERIGMIVDVSHLSDRGFYDVAELARKPFVASHSNARSICGHFRNLTDDMIKKTAECGGCIGLNFYRDFLVENQEDSALQALVRHAKHIVSVGGNEVLGLGSDFDGIDTNEELPGAQSMGLLWDALHESGFTQEQLDRIFYKNVLRLYREALR